MNGSWDDGAVVYGRGSEVALLKGLGVAVGGAAVTGSDTADLPGGTCRFLLVGTAGAAKLTMANGDVVDAVPLQAGYNPLAVKRVWSTGLAAASIVALY